METTNTTAAATATQQANEEYASLRHTDLGTLFNRVKDEKLRMEDYVVPARNLIMEGDGTFRISEIPGSEVSEEDLRKEWGEGLDALAIAALREARTSKHYTPLPLFHSQLCTKIGLGASGNLVGWKKYYDGLMRFNPELLSQNVNFWLQRQEEDRQFLVRSLTPPPGADSGLLRAFLSDRYLILNNADIMWEVMQTARKLGDDGGIRIQPGRCNLTEGSMYLELVAPDVMIPTPNWMRNYRGPDNGLPAEGLRAGVVISNSEVGTGAFTMTPRPTAVACCPNCFTFKQDIMRRAHLGVQLDQGVVEASAETVAANLLLITSQLSDALKTFLSVEYLEKVVGRIEKHDPDRKLDHPVQAVKNAATFLSMSEAEETELLGYFMRGHDDSRMGLVQAVTYHANFVGSADTQYEMERSFADVLRNVSKFDTEEAVSLN